MTSETVGTFLLYFAAPAATLFPIVYMATAPWWKSAVGRAIVVSKIGLASLVDASVLFHWLGPNYPYHDQVVLGAFGLIAVGTWMYLGALVEQQIRKRRK